MDRVLDCWLALFRLLVVSCLGNVVRSIPAMAGPNQPLSIDRCLRSRDPEVRDASLLGIRPWRPSRDGRPMGKGERADVRGGAGFGVGRATTLDRAPCRSVSCHRGVLGYEYGSLSGSPSTSQPQ